MTPPPLSTIDAREIVEAEFASAQIPIDSLQIRDYPQETIFIVEVASSAFSDAAQLGIQVDQKLLAAGFTGFVTVRQSQAPGPVAHLSRMDKGVNDSRALDLSKVLIARSRASETQPSLAYVPDVSSNIASVIAARHHLVFGRRGAGKTALLAEAKRLVERDGHLSVWVNLQTHRHDPHLRAFLWIVASICDVIEVQYRSRKLVPLAVDQSRAIAADVVTLRDEPHLDETRVKRLIPRVQQLLRRTLETLGCRLYVFLDEFHYLPVGDQPLLLDMLHAGVRDTDAWLKIAAIRHLARWFQAAPPVGLQTGQDADHINLDVTLENPVRAKAFLEKVLRHYATHIGIPGLSSVFDSRALDRLVLASGAVPRDYLVLCATGIEVARNRENSKQVGVQDVNRAAGDRAKVKINELEDDAAATAGSAERILTALQTVRSFCFEEKQYTFFRVDFKDKEQHSAQYTILSGLMDVRLIHLVNASVSDEHKAGERSEVFMLDLSQFSGQRFKKRLRVLDFVRGNIVLRQTGTVGQVRIGNTSKKLLAILRRGPLFELADMQVQPLQ